MNYKKILRCSFWMQGFIFCAGAELVVAQESTPADAEEPLEEVIVTGSNIYSALEAESRAIPVEVISAEDIAATGANTLADVVANNPAIAGGLAAEQEGGGRGFVNLRSLGTQYTLVLVNGRRLSANDPANILAISANAVERIEILKSGASAVYGSDAVAGVVNVVLKTKSDGFGADVTFGDTTQGGGKTTSIDFYGGSEGEDSRFFFMLSHLSREGIRANQRDITSSLDQRRLGGFDERVDGGSPGRISGVTGSPSLILDTDRVPVGDFSLDPADYRPYDEERDLFDGVAAVNPSAVPAPRRFTALANFEREILDGRASLFAHGLYWQQREIEYQVPGDIFFDDPELGGIPASNPYNPFGEDLTDVVYTPIELGPVRRERDSFTRRLSAGVNFELGRWRGESALTWYRSGFGAFDDSSVTRSGLRAALNRPGADAFNPFCNQCNTTAQFAGVLARNSFQVDFRSDMADIRVSGPVFNLPTGEVQLAMGAEYRREGVAVIDDPLTQIAGFVGSVTTTPYDLERDIKSVFLESKIPLLPTETGTDSNLELSLAVRFEDYSDFGSESSPLATLRYAVLDQQLVFRVSYAEAFLAPYLESASPLYRQGFSDVVFDPVADDFVEAAIFDVGNPEIDAESSTTKNFGVIFKPENIAGLSLSFDYYLIDQSDLVPGTNAEATLLGLAPGNIIRGPNVGPSGQDLLVENFSYNLGRRKSSGYEFGVTYAMPTESYGVFETDLSVTRLAKFEVAAEEGSDELVDLAGGYDLASGAFFSTGALPRTRAAAGIAWERAAWSASTGINFTSGYQDLSFETGEFIGRKIGSYWTADLQVGYSVETARLGLRGADFSLGIDNVFDQDVPFVQILNFYNFQENDLFGRFIYGRVNLKF